MEKGDDNHLPIRTFAFTSVSIQDDRKGTNMASQTITCGSPEVETSVDYGYGDADPAVESYGYEEAGPLAYGYEDAAGFHKRTAAGNRAQQRRSSLKTSRNYQPRRRNSISYTGEIEVQLCDKTVVKRRTSISFTEQNEVREVESVLASGSKANLWTTPADYAASQREVRELLGLVQMVGCPKTLSRNMKHVCLRGLEPHLGRGDDGDDCLMSRFSVLDLQESQRMDGMYCDETLGQVYGELALTSTEKARQLGLQDYAEVKDEYDHMKTESVSINRFKRCRRASM